MLPLLVESPGMASGINKSCELAKVEFVKFLATCNAMDHSPIIQSFKLENNFSTVGKSFLNLVKL